MLYRKHELYGLFDLRDVARCGEATIEIGDAVSVVTPGAPWAYAAVLPLRRDAAARQSNGHERLIVEVKAAVTQGAVGIAGFVENHQQLLDEAVRYSEDGPTVFLLRLDCPAECGGLVVRNHAQDNRPSAVVLHSIRVFQLEGDSKAGLYIFDHIFKTGGTSFHQSYLKAAFPSREQLVLNGLAKENAEDLKRLRSLPDLEVRKLRIVAGHNAGTLRDAFPQAKFLTLTREPVARVVSAYLHALHHPDSAGIIGEYLKREGVSLREFVEADLFASRYQPFVSVHDAQARTLLGEDFEVERIDDDSVVGALRSRFCVVGCTESLELFLYFLHRTEGFPLVLFNNRLVREEARRFQLSAADRATIQRLNRADSMVHDVARREFDRRVSQIWNPEVEQDYRRYLEQLHSFRRLTGGDPNATRLLRP